MSLTSVFKSGNFIREIPENLAEACDCLANMPDDFFADGRQDEQPQKRDFF